MNRLIQSFLFICLFTGYAESVLLASSGNSLRYELQRASQDSSRVKILFQLGNLFIDGPSDSLLLYYNRSLEIILINLNHILRFEKNEGGHLVMDDNSQIPVSIRKREALFNLFNEIG